MQQDGDFHEDVKEGGLEALMRRADGLGRTPPVEKWNPEFCGDIDMRIAKNGLWYYMGTPIGRESLVRLFASVLRKDEDGKHYLVTPVEKIGIAVEDAPFLAVELHADGTGRDQVITVRTNVGDAVPIGPEHPMRFEPEPETEGVKPYVLIRGRLEALCARPLLFELVDIGSEETVDGADWFGIWSSGVFYPMMLAEDLRRLSA